MILQIFTIFADDSKTHEHWFFIHSCWDDTISICIYICWFNFDALAQGNAYKPTKEPINYRGPGGDRTHDLQTEATPPAASCPARTLHATEIAPKNATPLTCPWLHWTTDNPSGMHRCQFQHLCVLILNCALALAIYIFVGLILMLWHRETHINPQRNRSIIVDPAGIELTTSRLRQLRQLPVVQHVRFTPLKSRQKTQLHWHARGCTGQLTTRLECTGVNFNTCVC